MTVQYQTNHKSGYGCGSDLSKNTKAVSVYGCAPHAPFKIDRNVVVYITQKLYIFDSPTFPTSTVLRHLRAHACLSYRRMCSKNIEFLTLFESIFYVNAAQQEIAFIV